MPVTSSHRPVSTRASTDRSKPRPRGRRSVTQTAASASGVPASSKTRPSTVSPASSRIVPASRASPARIQLVAWVVSAPVQGANPSACTNRHCETSSPGPRNSAARVASPATSVVVLATRIPDERSASLACASSTRVGSLPNETLAPATGFPSGSTTCSRNVPRPGSPDSSSARRGRESTTRLGVPAAASSRAVPTAGPRGASPGRGPARPSPFPATGPEPADGSPSIPRCTAPPTSSATSPTSAAAARIRRRRGPPIPTRQDSA